MKPKVTIGVCVRNSEDYIKDAIGTILNQDFPHERMEVFFVDDGSEDKTLSIIKSYVPRMDMRARQNLGISREEFDGYIGMGPRHLLFQSQNKPVKAIMKLLKMMYTKEYSVQAYEVGTE